MENLPQRKRIRLRGYDYSQNGAYFVTICTHNREMIFGTISDGVMRLNENGFIAQANIEKLNGLYHGITIDKHVIMPNHIHMIITTCRERIACVPVTPVNLCGEPLAEHMQSASKDNPTKSHLAKIMQIFKSSVTKETREFAVRNACNAFPTIWQSHFHDHIIRNEREYQKIWQYIDTNPLQWGIDCFHPNRTP